MYRRIGDIKRRREEREEKEERKWGMDGRRVYYRWAIRDKPFFLRDQRDLLSCLVILINILVLIVALLPQFRSLSLPHADILSLSSFYFSGVYYNNYEQTTEIFHKHSNFQFSVLLPVSSCASGQFKCSLSRVRWLNSSNTLQNRFQRLYFRDFVRF